MSVSSVSTTSLSGEVDPGWGRTARVAGTFAGLAILVATLAYVAEATGLFAQQPTCVRTGSGPVADEAACLAAFIAYQKRVLWDVVLRDGLYFFGYLALIPFGLAVREVAGRRRVAPQLTVAFLTVAAIFGCLNALQAFVPLGYWRSATLEQVPPAIAVAVYRDLVLLGAASRWDAIASYVAFGIALYFLGNVARHAGFVPRWLGRICWLGAVVAALLAMAYAVPGTEMLFNVLALLIGVFVAPVVTIGIGISIERATRSGRGTYAESVTS